MTEDHNNENESDKTDEDNQVDENEFDALYAVYKTKSENEDTNTKIYIVFVFLRILMTLLPQSGYIHPDEFIQSIEVVGGSILNADVEFPWEFNRTNPVRSIFIPGIVHGVPIWCLKQLNRLLEYLFDINIITPYSLIVFPRFTLCVASFIIDYALYDICRIYSRPYHAKLTILASSYVMLVYATRTFSNTIEMILFSILIWMIAICIYDHQLIVKFRAQFLRISNGLETPRSRVKHLKILKLIESLNLQHCFLISCIAVIGCFNRPTFVLFGVGPIFFWIHRGLSSEYITVKDVHTRMLMFLISAVPLILLIILVDSSYFGYLTGPEIMNLDISLKNFVFPPWNFLKYNMNVNNLAKHGIHPKYVHFLVNMPLLFGCLAFVMGRSLLTNAIKFIQNPKLQGYNRAIDIDNFMRVTLLSPLILLSWFPHQEPRFIIPIILPLIFLYGDELYDILSKTSFMNTLFRLWMLFNFVMTIFYGFIHQGGVYHLSNKIHNEINTSPLNTTFHLVLSHTYSYPRVLLNQPDTNIIYRSPNGGYYQKKRRVYYYEQQSQSVSNLVDKVNIIYNTYKSSSTPFKIFICLPSLLGHEFETNIRQNDNFILSYIDNLFPHLSIESITTPDVWGLAKYETLHYKLLSIISKMEYVLSLNVYSISYTGEIS